jgi:hypothetical protein
MRKMSLPSPIMANNAARESDLTPSEWMAIAAETSGCFFLLFYQVELGYHLQVLHDLSDEYSL